MVSVELFAELEAALPHKPQYIFLGDIQQLPPVFGAAILGYKMLELKTIELVQVYRQALESPIIRLAHRILSGKAIPHEEYPEWKVEGKLTLHAWKKKLASDVGLLTAAKFFTTAIDNNVYNPDEDQILIPYNKSFGTDELNKHIAQHLARKRGAIVWEVIAGFNKHYFSVGDKVLVDKEDAVIVSISPNPTYYGSQAQQESATLDYWGCEQGTPHHIAEIEANPDDVDFMLDQMANASDEDRVRKSSHIIKVEMLDSGTVIAIDKAAEVNSMLLAYALTVHKSQGSEWRKVFCVFHQSHATMMQRELLYTSVTRAKEELYVICEPETFTKGIVSQKIKGNTLAEKAEFFKGRVERGGMK
jgi:ATP-dependent exoDNAse (exonuclease V) alpha subunit